eukprot:5486873-Amphidinium_carterae.1
MVNKGKGKRKGKNKGGKGKGARGGKDSKTVTCYTCGQQGHISPNCPTKKCKGKGKDKKGQWPGYGQGGSWQPQSQSQGYNPAGGGYSGYSGQPPYTGQPPYNAKGKGHGQPQQWNNCGKGNKGQVANIADDPNAYNEQWHPDYAYQDQSYVWVPD